MPAMLRGTVLEPHEIAGVWASGVEESCRSRAGTSGRRPCRSLCGPGCGSRARPPGGRPSRPGCTVAAGAGGVHVLAGEPGQVDQCLRPPAGQPELLEERRPEPDRQGQPRRLEAHGLAVSSGGASASPPNAPSPTARPAVIRRAASVQSLSIWTNSARASSSRRTRRMQPVCTGCDARLCARGSPPRRAVRTRPATSCPYGLATAPPPRGAARGRPAPADQRTARGLAVPWVSVMVVPTSQRRRRAWTAALRARSRCPTAPCAGPW